jgi:hypothetical protein
MENQIASESLAECLPDKKVPTNRKGNPVGGELHWTALEGSDVLSRLEFHSARPGGRGRRQRLRLWHIDDRRRSRRWLRRGLLFHDRRWSHFLFFLWTGDRTTCDSHDASQYNRSWRRTWRRARDRTRSRTRDYRLRSRTRDYRSRSRTRRARINRDRTASISVSAMSTVRAGI